MSTQDRRSGIERRGTNRYPIDVEIEWEGSAGRRPGAISDVSLEGCFVLSSGDVGDGEQIRVFVPLSDGMKVEFSGQVANHVLEIGFGLKFEPLSAPQRELLINIVREQQD